MLGTSEKQRNWLIDFQRRYPVQFCLLQKIKLKLSIFKDIIRLNLSVLLNPPNGDFSKI